MNHDTTNHLVVQPPADNPTVQANIGEEPKKPAKYVDPDERMPGRTGLNQSAEDIMVANNFLGDL